MIKNPVYGCEQPFLEQLGKELTPYADQIFSDSFENLIVERNGKKRVVVCLCVSENALLINQLTPDGKAKFSPLYPLADTLCNERILSYANRLALIDPKANTLDFGMTSEKAVSRVVKVGDMVYLKAFCESFGEYYLTNELSYFLTDMMAEFLKTNDTPLSVCFLREKGKGAHALAKNYPTEKAFFLTVSEQLPQELCFIKKEGDFVSPLEQLSLPVAVSEKEISLSNFYFTAGGAPKVAGIALKADKLPNGHYKIKKETVKALFAFLNTLL